MKKIILSIVIAIAVFSTAFANAPTDIKGRAAVSFQKEFRNASQVSWATTENHILAKFELNHQTMFAYYDFDGNLIGVIHHILTSELSDDLQQEIKKQYAGFWVADLFQITTDEGVHYYIQLKSADETLVLSNEGAGGWQRFSVPKNVIEKL